MNASVEKQSLKRLAMILLAGLIGVCGSAADATEAYGIDKAHSAVGFQIRHFFSNVPGRFMEFDGALHYDAVQPENSHIELVIQAASIDTDNESRDNHLRSADFFDVANHPTITFHSTAIAPTAKANHYQVTGDLTIRGVTKSVVVEVEILGFGEIAGMGHRGGFNAQATINRIDFGVSWNRVFEGAGAMLSDEVQVEIALEVVKEASAK